MSATRGNAYESSQTFKSYKSQAARAARELCYGPDVVKAVESAKTEGEIECIMRTARNGKR